jgi:hypothetical protein
MNTGFTLEKFIWVENETEQSYFDRWFFRFETIMKLYNLDLNNPAHSDEFKEFLCSYGGDAMVKVILNEISDFKNSTYIQVKAKLAKYYKKDSRRFNEFQFVNLKPKADDTIRSYSTKLKEAGRIAGYNDAAINNKCIMLILQHAKLTKVKALCMEDETTLEKLIAWEAIARDVDPHYLNNLFTDHSSTINAIHIVDQHHAHTTPKLNNNSHKQNSNSLHKLNDIINTGKAPCIYCNGNFPHGPNELCADNITCSFCGNTGHVAINCFKRINTVLQAANYSRSNRRNQSNIYDPRNKKTSQNKQNNNKPIKSIEQECTNTDGNQNCLKMEFEDDDDIEPNRYSFDTNDYNLFSIQSKPQQQRDDFTYVYLNVYGIDIKYLMDTGAGVNVTLKSTFDKFKIKPKLITQNNCRLTGFCATQKIKPLGAFKAKLTINGISDTVTMVVVDDSNTLNADNILSKHTLQKFKMVSYHVNNNINSISTNNTSHFKKPIDPKSQEQYKHETAIEFIARLKKMFPRVVQDRVGHMMKYEKTDNKIIRTPVKLHIDIDKNKKPTQKIYDNVPYSLMPGLKHHIETLTSNDVMKKVPAHETINSFIGTLRPVEKKDLLPDGIHHKVRITSDSTGLNSAIIKKPRKLPNKKSVLRLIKGKKFFTKLDIREAFHTVELDDESVALTTVSTPFGLYQIKRLWMGCCVASELFHETLGDGLIGLANVDHHIDDIIIMSDTIENGKLDIINCFQRLDELNLTINPSKLAILQQEIEYWGLIIDQNGVRPIKDKVEALKNTTNPTNPKEVLSLLSSLSYYIDRIPYLSTLAIPLRELSTTKKNFKWTDEHSKILKEIKNSIIETSLDHYDPFDPNVVLELWVDAGPKGTGAFLVQNRNKVRSLIACASKTHSSSQMNYSHVEKECESIVWSCIHFKDELIGRKFTLYTDNESASKILNPFNELKKMTTYRMQLWRSNMAQFSGINIQHIPGNENMADYLSRCFETPTQIHSKQIIQENGFGYDENDMEEYVSKILTLKHYIKTLTLGEIATETAKDPILKLITESIRSGNKYLPKSKHFGTYKPLYNEISIAKNNILMYNDVIIIPDSLRQRLIDLTHEGHMGINSCKNLIRNNYYFRDLDSMMALHAKTCHACQTVTDTSRFEPIIPTDIPCTKNSHWDIDFKSHTPSNDSILVIIDEATEFPILITTKKQTSDSAINALKQVFKKYGIPKNIKSDNGPAFASADFKAFMKACNINYQAITPVWPRANGSAERFMKNLNRVIRCALVEQKNWKNEMVKYINNYRATPHTMTKISPNEAMNLVDNVKFPTVNRPQRNNIETIIKNNNTIAKQRMKHYGDKHLNVKSSTFKENDLVLVKFDKDNKNTVGKYNPIFDPKPYKIKKMKGSMIEAERIDHSITRNSQFFRKFYTKSNAIMEPIDIKPITNITAFPVYHHLPIMGAYVPRSQRNHGSPPTASEINKKTTSTNTKHMASQEPNKENIQSSLSEPTTSGTSAAHDNYLLDKNSGPVDKTNKNYVPIPPQTPDVIRQIKKKLVMKTIQTSSNDQHQKTNPKSNIIIQKKTNTTYSELITDDEDENLETSKRSPPIRQLFKQTITPSRNSSKTNLLNASTKSAPDQTIDSDHESNKEPTNTSEIKSPEQKDSNTRKTKDSQKTAIQLKTKRKKQKNDLIDKQRDSLNSTDSRPQTRSTIKSRSKSQESIVKKVKSALNGNYWS